jgi:ribosome assembly protein YihI (activator of Der GTPase)
MDVYDLAQLLDDAEACDTLTEWEQEFLDSMRERLEQYREYIRISDNQEAVLERISAKVYED